MYKKEGLLVLLIGLVFFSILSSSFVIAAIEDFDNCDDYCNDFWMSAMPACLGEQDTTGEYPDCECGWKCDEDEIPEGLERCRDDCKATYDNEETILENLSSTVTLAILMIVIAFVKGNLAVG